MCWYIAIAIDVAIVVEVEAAAAVDTEITLIAVVVVIVAAFWYIKRYSLAENNLTGPNNSTVFFFPSV